MSCFGLGVDLHTGNQRGILSLHKWLKMEEKVGPKKSYNNGNSSKSGARYFPSPYQYSQLKVDAIVNKAGPDTTASSRECKELP